MRTNALSVLFVAVMMVSVVGPAAAVGSAGTTAGGPPAMAGIQAQQGSCSFPVTMTDATGTEVTIEEEPQRVVVLGASTAQIMWEIGAKEKVVGMPVNPSTAYLNGSQNRTGTFMADQFTVATETVVGLEPDLVIAPGIIPNETVSQLRSAGITVYDLGFPQSIEGTYELVNRTGRLVGACEGAERIVTAMQERVSTIQQAVRNESEPRVLYGTDFVAGNNTLVSDIIKTAGAENLAANAGIADFAQISDEVVAERNPQWLVVTNASQIPAGAPWAGTTAVQQNQTIVVNSNYISQPAPRVIFPLTEIARQLHPEAMESANLSATPIGPANLDMENATTEQPVAADGGNATGTTMAGTTIAAPDGTTEAAGTTAATPPGGDGTTMAGGAAAGGGDDQADNGTAGGGTGTGTSSGNGAGFGVAVAAVALLGGALLARRRT